MSRVLAVMVAAFALGGCGGGEDDDGAAPGLAWEDEPVVLTPPDLPRDRILTGAIRNDSERRAVLAAADMRLLDRAGRALRADIGFLGGYVAPDEPGNRGRDALLDGSEQEAERRGRRVTLDPGETTSITIAWRVRERDRPRPHRIDYGSGSLSVR